MNKVKSYIDFNKGVNMKLCNFILLLNLFGYSSFASSLSFGSVLCRTIQIVTIVVSFFLSSTSLFFRIKEIKINVLLLLLLIISMSYSTLVNESDLKMAVQIVAIYMIHFLYILSIALIIFYTKDKIYQKLVFLFFLFNIIYFFTFFSYFSIDFSYFSLQRIDEFIQIKNTKKIINDVGYNMIFPSLILLSFFMSFKYIMEIKVYYKIFICKQPLNPVL